MRQLTAFMGKEWTELLRTGKALVLSLVFVLLGMMNPAIAKLTPWLLELVSDSMESSGIAVTGVEVNALASWTQFYKNAPMLFLFFLLMFGGILTGEYRRGTLVNMATKGMKRWKILASKLWVMLLCWTAGFWCCYGITYGYNAYFWDNGVVCRLAFPAFCLYLAGVWLVTLLLLASAVTSSSSAALLVTGGGFGIVYLLGMLPDCKRWLPAQLFNAFELVMSAGGLEDYYSAIAVTLGICVVHVGLAVSVFNRRYL